MQTPPPRAGFDQALKRLLLHAHDGFLALVAPDLTWRGELSPELPAVARQADVVWRVAHAGGLELALHLELQTRPDPDIGERLAEYDILLWRRDHLPVRSAVIYLRPAATVPEPPFVLECLGVEYLRYTYDVVRLWEIPLQRVLATPYYELWALAGLLAGATAETTAEVAERLMAAPLPRQERTELVGARALLAGIRLPRGALLEALRRRPMLEDIWRESSIATYLVEEGEERGRTEGRVEGMRQMARVVLEGRFGPLDAEVGAADEATLSPLMARIATATLADVRAGLGLP